MRFFNLVQTMTGLNCMQLCSKDVIRKRLLARGSRDRLRKHERAGFSFSAKSRVESVVSSLGCYAVHGKGFRVQSLPFRVYELKFGV